MTNIIKLLDNISTKVSGDMENISSIIEELDIPEEIKNALINKDIKYIEQKLKIENNIICFVAPAEDDDEEQDDDNKDEPTKEQEVSVL